VNALTLDLNAPALGVVVTAPQRADCVWTWEEFLVICGHMLNGNPLTEFLLVYRDEKKRPKFAKSKKARADRRASWAWDTILGRAKSKVGIGFYPWNADGKTRWGAMDFDAHDGNALRARGLAMAAFDLLHRQPGFYVVLCTSGSDGWHLFAFRREYYSIGDWTLLFKKVAAHIGAEVRPGICEVFPNDTSTGCRPCGIRASGTWNPKTDALGSIAYSGGASSEAGPWVLTLGVSPFGANGKKERRKESPFLYHATHSVAESRLHDREGIGLYRGMDGEWKAQFAITQLSTRCMQLKALTHHIFRQVGREVARRNAEAQHREADRAPPARAA
jgi:hypothetical protein